MLGAYRQPLGCMKVIAVRRVMGSESSARVVGVNFIDLFKISQGTHHIFVARPRCQFNPGLAISNQGQVTALSFDDRF